MPISQYKLQLGHCFLEEVSLSSKISVLPMSVINFFDSSLNVLIFSVLFKSCRKDSLFGWFSNCWLNFLTVSLRFVSSCWTVEWSYEWYSIVKIAAAGSPVTSRYALVFRGFSCFLLKLILLSTFRVRAFSITRGIPWRLVYFMVKLLLSLYMHTAFSRQVARVLTTERLRVIVLDRKCNPFFWASFKLHQFTVLCPSFFVCCDPWLVQVASNFFHALIVVHRVHWNEKHRQPVPFGTSSS